MKYKSFTLDKFQEDAIHAMERNESVMVSAPTGSGKTLIADYIIDRDIKEGKKIIYTAPIKALSNQKFKDFTHTYGKDKIGILTGDIVVNPNGLVLIMTTEVYRNMILVNDPLIQDVSYVIFDEIHFINDVERGHIWEESIIFSPEHVRFVCLSATVPNYKEFALWIETIKGHKVATVKHHTRPVPLERKFFDAELGITTLEKIKEAAELDNYGDYKSLMKGRFKRAKVKPPTHDQLIMELKRKGLLPCIYFVFSRVATQKKAEILAKRNNFLTNTEKKRVAEVIAAKMKNVDPEIKMLKTTGLVRYLLSRGVGVHHAGLIPVLKDLVEALFSEGLVKVLYATETFAVGINMPAKTVGFDSLEKYDGRSFRYLSTKEYFQLAGRAGRRGIDKKGLAVALVHRTYDDLKKIEAATTEDKEPIISHFKLSYNTMLNMIHQFDEEEIKYILKSNFGFFQKYGVAGLKDKRKQTALWANYCRRKKILERNGYVVNDKLTQKGMFTTHIYSYELLISELFFEGHHKDLSEFQILLLILSIIFEPRPATRFKMTKQRNREVDSLIRMLRENPFFKAKINLRNVQRLTDIVHMWYHNAKFVEILKMTNLLEGDLIRLFRLGMDFLSQIHAATVDTHLKHKINNCIDILNRDLIRVSFD